MILVHPWGEIESRIDEAQSLMTAHYGRLMTRIQRNATTGDDSSALRDRLADCERLMKGIDRLKDAFGQFHANNNDYKRLHVAAAYLIIINQLVDDIGVINLWMSVDIARNAGPIDSFTARH